MSAVPSSPPFSGRSASSSSTSSDSTTSAAEDERRQAALVRDAPRTPGGRKRPASPSQPPTPSPATKLSQRINMCMRCLPYFVRDEADDCDSVTTGELLKKCGRCRRSKHSCVPNTSHAIASLVSRLRAARSQRDFLTAMMGQAPTDLQQQELVEQIRLCAQLGNDIKEAIRQFNAYKHKRAGETRMRASAAAATTADQAFLPESLRDDN